MHTPRPIVGQPYALTRAEFFNALRLSMGGRCARCGETETLDFHHRDPSSKVGEVTRMGRHEALSEASKCILLCPTCHRREHSVEEWTFAVHGRHRRGAGR